MIPDPRSAVALALVGLLVATAGCGALESTDDRDPYGVDEEVDPDRIPGLTEDGVEDRIELRNAHVEGLESESYRQTVHQTTRNESGVVPERTYAETLLVAEGGTPAWIERGPANATPEADRLSVEWWIDDGTAYIRSGNDSEAARYDARPNSGVDPAMPISLIDVYDAVDTVEPAGDGYRLEGTADDLGGYGDARVVVTLTEEGIVDTYRVEGTFTRGGERYTSEIDVEVETGEVDLEEPAWVEEAKEQTEAVAD